MFIYEQQQLIDKLQFSIAFIDWMEIVNERYSLKEKVHLSNSSKGDRCDHPNVPCSIADSAPLQEGAGGGGSNNPCQQKFERDFQYIHGQFDSAIMGATIGFAVGGYTSNLITLATAGIVSFGAVSRAIYKISVAIDDYNDCMKDRG